LSHPPSIHGSSPGPAVTPLRDEPVARPPAAVSSEPRVTAAPAFRHILVTVDGSTLAEAVIPYLELLADAFSCRTTLLRALESEAGHDRPVDALEWEMRRAEAHQQLQTLRGALKTDRAEPEAEVVVSGRPFEQILQAAEARGADLIVLASHGVGGIDGCPRGATAYKVSTLARTSLLVVPAYDGHAASATAGGLMRFLVALDCSPRAEAVLPLASALARVHDTELVLSHVVVRPELPRPILASRDDVRLADELVARNRAEAERYLSQLETRLTAEGVRARTRLLVAEQPSRALLELADEEDVGLVLCSAHGRTAHPRERYGSVATRLLQEACRPVLVLQDVVGGLREPRCAEQAAGNPAHH
jgi:nucleotide-binding universal stress UspA family protein